MLADLYQWLCGGAQYSYHELIHCFDGDTQGMWFYACSGIFVFCSYLLIVAYFFSRYLKVKKTRFANAMMLGSMVFLSCGMTGYMMSGLVEIYWPVRRLETLMRIFTGLVNIFYAISLYRISFVEKVLNIDVIAPQNGSNANALGR